MKRYDKDGNPISIADAGVELKIVSEDGFGWNTHIEADGKTVYNVTGLHIDVDSKGMTKATLDLIGNGFAYSGAMNEVSRRPTCPACDYRYTIEFERPAETAE